MTPPTEEFCFQLGYQNGNTLHFLPAKCNTQSFRPPSFVKGFSNSLDQTGHPHIPGAAHSPSSLEVSCLTTDSGERVGGLPSGCRRLFLISIFILEKAEAAWKEAQQAGWAPQRREQEKRGRALVKKSSWIHTANFSLTFG